MVACGVSFCDSTLLLVDSLAHTKFILPGQEGLLKKENKKHDKSTLTAGCEILG